MGRSCCLNFFNSKTENISSELWKTLFSDFINLLMKQSEALQFFAMEIIREMEKLMPHATGEVGRKANDVS